MSLRESVYWTAHAIEALAAGLLVAFVVASLSSATTLFNHGAWGSIFALIFAFSAGVAGLAFAIASVFGSPQTAGQVALGVQIASIVLYLVVLKPDVQIPDDATAFELRLWSLLPHAALELGVNSFRGPPTESKHNAPNRNKRLEEGCHNGTKGYQYSIGCPGLPNNNDDEIGALYNATGWTEATYRKYRAYSQYHGIPLSAIVGILFLDAVAYSLFSWYLSQVIPSSEFGTRKPWYFICSPKYWFGDDDDSEDDDAQMLARAASIDIADDIENPIIIASQDTQNQVIIDEPFPVGTAPPTVRIHRLRKCFGNFIAVNNLTFDMRQDQIFSLLGHNGAGKSTAINVLTGLLPSDARSADGGALIYGHAIRTEMDAVRRLTGVCPQHDVLFDLLTSFETLDLFASLKGSSSLDAKREATELLNKFHLSHRAGHKAHELSGGMRRKVSCAVALCGRSRFVLLDEPTAGMDALARRELWDLLADSKRGRTVLLTTHYMDEADVLGDRIGIMSHGQLKCAGTSSFLKRQFGTGYSVVCRLVSGFTQDLDAAKNELEKLASDTQIPNAKITTDIVKREVIVGLPREEVQKYPEFFAKLDKARAEAKVVEDYGLAITTLEDVFIAVGADETVAPAVRLSNNLRIGAGRQYYATTVTQAVGIFEKRLRIASRDFRTVALLILPIGGLAAGFAINKYQVISKNDKQNDMITAAIVAGSFLIYPALVAEQVVAEKESKLRNVLTVAGCEVRAYWIGNFLGDYCLFLIVAGACWIAAFSSALTRWLENAGIFYFTLVFGAFLLSYSYALSYAFESAKRCVVTVPGIQIAQLLAPQIIALIVYLVIRGYIKSFHFDQVQGMELWLLTLLSPQGAFWLGFYNIASTIPLPQKYCPRFYEIMIILAIEFYIFTTFVYSRDLRALAAIERREPSEAVAQVTGGDQDVQEERRLVLSSDDGQTHTPGGHSNFSLIIKRLRKVYPAKLNGASDTVAVHDCTFRVARGEVFGLLGANGAGKSTTINCIIRAHFPTAGDILVNGHSVLDDFEAAAKSLGVVNQGNSLWDLLSCADHLKLFAQLRGVPSAEAKLLVEAAIDQLELRPHKNKLAHRLSGGMKRKLATAIAIVGDPELVLLDEPSAGLDPVSRRNMWNVLRTTMEARAVVLTSHLMEEVEALCDRVSIMVKGKIRCLGTIQHLKNSLGSHYELDIVGIKKSNADPIHSLVYDIFGKDAVNIASTSGGLLCYEVKKEAVNVGKVFDTLEKHKEIISEYSIAQPSLESVFIKTVQSYDDDNDFALGHDFDDKVEETMTGCTRIQLKRLAW
eukprot:CAMPEP_0197307030 /NCGR_PEP_ID=MMETSP0891-20130614/4467_1 /TAXON_ID=44058 ORGANISM="Aureoumbra lagunensis, Strain CCMP1510" /NCGR_SAMPLE_ID=MMETSP0891 /ASSEMBLY_ACC=CAM_ASM_000534 /LENGTH=1306 /DNA_ID=CAMNT_0042790003 /DNA_START=140 /DNA_END=4057 /DNA_ORIENTATION=-